MTAPKNFYLSELQVSRKRRTVACDSVPSWIDRDVITPRAAAEVFCAILGTGLLREHFLVLMVDARNRILGYELCAIGVGTHVETSPSDVFRAAILCGAAGVILMHNHPSGDPEPSPQDILVTEQMIRAGLLIGVPVLDHVVVADEYCVSINEYVRRAP